MIPAFIPSKDRASQLLLLLESLERNAPDMFQPYIMYKSSNEDFDKGYEIVQNSSAGKNCVWMEETYTEKQFYIFLEEAANKLDLVCLFSDDCIFFRKSPISVQTIYDIFLNYSIFTFTFRLGKNITIRDYVDQRPTQQPQEYFDGNNTWYWKWSNHDFWDMFGFTVGFDGYIYRPQDLLNLSEKRSFDNRICFWERMICQQFLSKRSDRELMAAPYESCVFIQQINITHEFGHRSNHTFHASKEDLNKQLLDGYKIDLDSIDFSDVNCTHGEKRFEFKELNNGN